MAIEPVVLIEAVYSFVIDFLHVHIHKSIARVSVHELGACIAGSWRKIEEKYTCSIYTTLTTTIKQHAFLTQNLYPVLFYIIYIHASAL